MVEGLQRSPISTTIGSANLGPKLLLQSRFAGQQYQNKNGGMAHNGSILLPTPGRGIYQATKILSMSRDKSKSHMTTKHLCPKCRLLQGQ